MEVVPRPKRRRAAPKKAAVESESEEEEDDGNADGNADLLELPTLSRDLRLVVTHDWEQITRKPQHWAPLPRTPCVADLLQTYAATKPHADIPAWRDFSDGLVRFFDEALPRLLLYREERQQYDLRARGRGAPSRIYGAEHLLRLIIKLPTLLAQTLLAEGELPRLRHKLEDLLTYLSQNKALVFLPAYQLRESIMAMPPPPPLAPAPVTSSWPHTTPPIVETKYMTSTP
jgi:mortality factor 4-like protein 1